MEPTRLTKYSHGAGCACKLGPAELEEVIAPIRGHAATIHPNLTVGIENSDDAGVYALEGGRSLVQSVDIFTPVVDDPADWGRIAAANALSDIYAMGGEPITSLQFLAWPRGELAFSIASEVIAGGLEVMEKARCTVLGGHSIDGPEPTFGYAVTGLVDPDRVITNAGARPGDSLVLTKPLGIGIITTSIKRGNCPPEVATAAIELMTSLNDEAGRALAGHDATAATDVTGFGLLGHLAEMCDASGVGAEIRFEAVPVLEGSARLLAGGNWAGGSQRNLEAIRPRLSSDLPEESVKLAADAQTSGGLLVALPPERASAYAQLAGGREIGRVTSGGALELI